VVIVSPEILNNDAHFEDLWGTNIFTENLINLVLDKARVVKEWSSTFCSDYLLYLYTLSLTTESYTCYINHSYGSLTIW
jgi:hypothetical protein